MTSGSVNWAGVYLFGATFLCFLIANYLIFKDKSNKRHDIATYKDYYSFSTTSSLSNEQQKLTYTAEGALLVKDLDRWLASIGGFTTCATFIRVKDNKSNRVYEVRLVPKDEYESNPKS